MKTALDMCHHIYVKNRSASATFQGLMTPIFAEQGLRPLEGCVLAELGHEDDRAINDLAHATSIRPTNLPPLCKALEEKGLVARRKDDEDGRSCRLSLTAAGKKALDSIDRRVARRLALDSIADHAIDIDRPALEEADREELVRTAFAGFEALDILLNE